MPEKIDLDKETMVAELQGSLLEFCKVFYPLLTGRDFIISQPIGREAHAITISRALTRAARLQIPSMRLIINVPPGHGKPLCGETTTVLRDDGEIIKLKDVEIGDYVLTHTGQFKCVLNKFEQGVLPVLKITTFCGREIRSARDHSFLTAKGWKEAGELLIGDVLGSAVPKVNFGKKINLFEARLLGYFIGDGCCSGDSANITNCDPGVIDDIIECCESLGFECEIKKYGLKNKLEHHSKETVRVNIKKGVRDWLDSHGLRGKTSYTKFVPEIIMKSDLESISHFIGAYFSCDGTLGHKGQGREDLGISITSVSKKILQQVQHLFLRLGIRSRIRVKIRNQLTKKQGSQYTSYNLDITSQDDAYNFKQKIVILHSKKIKILNQYEIQRLRFDADIFPDSIINIEEDGFADCYCLEIEEDHTFMANDLIVHNSTFLCMWVAWTLSKYPDSRFLYISYSKSLAAKHTETIKRIIGLRHYKYLFDVSIRWDSKAKEFFQTTAGGSIAAFGSAGAIVGQDGGLPGLDRFSGAVIMDDSHKIDEAHSQTIREGVIANYRETIQQRARGVNVPYIYIGQRVHEGDLAAYLIDGKDGYEWEKVILQSIDSSGNALYPEAFPKESLLIKQEKDPYVFASQFQQNPIPAGGGLFKPDWFVTLDEEPEMLVTFITCDTAETDKSWNDATVFSFWGVYEIVNFGKKSGEIGLHWLDTMELRVEPKDLKDSFVDFYTECTRHRRPPLMAAIEKKSTGVTLVSILKELRGVTIREIERTRASGSKTQRFLEMQPYIASKLISFTKGAKHREHCIKHMASITANDSHRHDDICDTVSDAIRLALIDKTVYSIDKKDNTRSEILSGLNRKLGDKIIAGKARYDRTGQEAF